MTRGSAAMREAATLALAGVLLFPLVVAGFALRTEASLAEALFIATLVQLLPMLAVAQVPLAVSQEIERLPAYAGSAVMILVLGGVALALGRGEGGWAELGLVGLPAWEGVFWTVGVLLTALTVFGAFAAFGHRFDIPESTLLGQLLPTDSRERVAFVGLSGIAGLGEELAFRGFALPAVAALFWGMWGAAVFTSVAFGVLHAYQGAIGVFRTAAVGMIFAAAYLLSGSLWPSIAAHAALDVIGGLWLGPHLLRTGKEG